MAHSESSDRLRFYRCHSDAWHATNDEKHRKRGQHTDRARKAKRRQQNRSRRRQSRQKLR